MMELAFKRYFTLEAYTLDGLMYKINYYSERGFKSEGTFTKEGNKYIQIMKNPNPAMGY